MWKKKWSNWLYKQQFFSIRWREEKWMASKDRDGKSYSEERRKKCLCIHKGTPSRAEICGCAISLNTMSSPPLFPSLSVSLLSLSFPPSLFPSFSLSFPLSLSLIIIYNEHLLKWLTWNPGQRDKYVKCMFFHKEGNNIKDTKQFIFAVEILLLGFLLNVKIRSVG